MSIERSLLRLPRPDIGKGAVEIRSLTPVLEAKLVRLYELMRPKAPGQDFLGCIDASEIVSGMFNLAFRGGSFLLDSNVGPMTLPHVHAWVEDANGIIIDFTRHQFNSRLAETDRIPVERLAIIRPGDRGYERYATTRQVTERRVFPAAA